MAGFKFESPEELNRLVGGFQRSRIVLTAFELGLFNALAKEASTSADLARELKTDPRATDRLLNALAVLGLVDKKDRIFELSELSAGHLVEGRPGYLGGLGHWNHLWNTWSHLTRAVKSGGARDQSPFDQQDQSRHRAFIAAMHHRAAHQARELAEGLDLAGVKRVLDVGGGSGAFSMALVRAGQGIRATVLDLPQIIPLTREYLAAEGLEDRIQVKEGDYLKDDLGNGFDLVLLSAVIHINSPEENQDLVVRCHRALNPKGRLVISDFIMDEDRLNPPFGAFFALNMLVGTGRGDTYTEAEVRGWLQAAGFGKVERRNGPGGTGLVLGYKD